MESTTTLLACNKRYIVSAQGDRVQTRRTNEALTLLKPDYLGHKGAITHLAIHQPDNCYGTQDDWGRVVASSDVTNRVKVWLCDGEEEELMFARNMAEYVGYEEVTALAWTGDSKVAIGDVAGNFIVFNARYATSRYNRTVPKAILAIAPSHTDPHIHAVGYRDGSILLIRTNPSFQILFTNSSAHTSPIVCLAWRPEFSAARTYTEKDGKVHKSSAEDMMLLASCPAIKGEFRIWTWSSKSEKLTAFRDEKGDAVSPGESRAENGLQWSRNGKVVQFIEGEVQIWDVKKLQIQSELFLPPSTEMRGIAVDGHRGIIYTLSPDGVSKHTIPTKSTNAVPAPNLDKPTPASPSIKDTTAVETSKPELPAPPRKPELPAPSPKPDLRAPSPKPELRAPSPKPELRAPSPKPEIRAPSPQPELHALSTEPPERSIEPTPAPTFVPSKPSPPAPPERTASVSTDASTDSQTGRVKLMARQFDEDSNVVRRKTSNNFIANAKAKYTIDRRKRTITNDNDLFRARSPEPESRSESRIGMRSPSVGSTNGSTKTPSLFDIATSRIPNFESSRTPLVKQSESKIPTLASHNTKEQPPPNRANTPEPKAPKRAGTPENQKSTIHTLVPEQKLPPSPQPSPSFKPIDRIVRQPSPVPLAVTIPEPAKPLTPIKDIEATPPVHENVTPPRMNGRDDELDFLESPVLGEMLTSNLPIMSKAPTPPTTFETLSTITSGDLSTILEETVTRDAQKPVSIPPLKIVKPPSQEKVLPSPQKQITPPNPVFITQPLAISNDNPVQTIKRPTSSSLVKVAEPSSGFEDFGGIPMDDHDRHDDVRSDTSVESMHSAKEDPEETPQTPKNVIMIPNLNSPPSTPIVDPIFSTNSSPVATKSSRASRIFAERNGQNIHTTMATYLSDGDERTPSPVLKSSTAIAPVEFIPSGEDVPLDSPSPYRNSLKDYDLFRNLTKKMMQANKDQLEVVLSTKLTQFTLCKAFFGYESVRKLLDDEIRYAKQANIGLTELLLKLWVGADIEDEALLKAILFGKNNGLSESLVISLAPLAGLEIWESLMLWCTESPSGPKSEAPHADVIIGNQLVKTHIYAGFLCYNGSWQDAVEIYRKAKMYREAILMAMMAISAEERETKVMISTIMDLFHSWGDHVAAQQGNGVLVSMCFAATTVTFDPITKPRRVHYESQLSTRSPSPEDIIRPRKLPSREQSPEQSPTSPTIPIIRTQKASPTDTSSNASTPKPKPSPNGTLQTRGRNWAELASFMRTQKEKGYQSIRSAKQVRLQHTSPPSSGNSSPSLSLPVFPKSRSRPGSPAGRQTPTRRYTDDEDWSQSVRRREHLADAESSYSPSHRRPSLASSKLSSSYDSRGTHDMPSPLTFGARGASIKPQSPEAPPLPTKAGGRERVMPPEKEIKRSFVDGEKRLPVDVYGVGLGIQSMRERTRV